MTAVPMYLTPLGHLFANVRVEQVVGVAMLLLFMCMGYELGRWMEASTPKRFHRYFVEQDWHVLGHCSCCESGRLADGESDAGASGGVDHATGAA